MNQKSLDKNKSKEIKKGVREKIRWFNEHSPSYMSGYSKWYYWTHYLKALIKFLWLSR